MEEEEEALFFTPRSRLQRTPPSGLAPPHCDCELPIREAARIPLTVPVTMATITPSGPAKRPLTSPDERRPDDVVRVRRAEEDEESAARRASAAVRAPLIASGASTSSSATAAHPPCDDEDDEDNGLVGATKTALLDRVHRDVAEVMSACTGPTSKLNKESTNAISARCREILAVVAALALKLGDAEVQLSEAKLQAAKAEQELLRARTQPAVVQPAPAPPSVAAPLSYASALRLSRNADPVRIPAAQGPVLAFYPAADQVDNLKSAEDTKAELKKCIKPQEINVQVDRLRKVGNAGVVVQTTSEESAEKLKKAVPATLRVTEPKRRSPLVSLRHVDGDGDFEFVMSALHEQNFKESEWSLERLRAQSRLAFKKRGRGTSTVVLECSPKLREALLEKEKVYIGWQVIDVVDFLSVTCCRKCHMYGHPEKYCRAKEVFCGRCGDAGHAREECKSAAVCCATCKRFNKADAATHVTAAAACPARQYAEARSLSNTNYGQ